MSTTEIFGIEENGDVIKVGETEDAFRGAMFIWMQLCKRYKAGGVMDPSPLWELRGTKRLEENDELVLDTTLDGAVVMKPELPRVLAAFKAFDQTYPGSSLPEQAAIIRREILNQSQRIGVCWNQTSGIGHAWEVTESGTASYVPYNVNHQSDHWLVQ